MLLGLWGCQEGGAFPGGRGLRSERQAFGALCSQAPCTPPHPICLQGIGLAIQALHALLAAAPARRDCRLVVAGGYDERLAENVEHLRELRQLAADLGLADKVGGIGVVGGGWVGGTGA